jgi:Ran GTPase-activating protein 1
MVAPINQYTLDDNTVFSIVGLGLKLDTADDVQEFVETINQMDNLQVIKLSGNTLGVPASKALAAVLQTKTTLKVSIRKYRLPTIENLMLCFLIASFVV